MLKMRLSERLRTVIMSFVLFTSLIGLASTMVYAQAVPGGSYVGYVYLNGLPITGESLTDYNAGSPPTQDFTITSSNGHYDLDTYNDGFYEIDITLYTTDATTGSITCTVPGVGSQTLNNVDLTKDNLSCNWYFTTSSQSPSPSPSVS